MIAYRDATPADGPALDAMARAAWLATFGETAAPADVARYLAQAYGPGGKLLADLASGAARFRLAVAGGRIVGYAKINPPWLPDAEPGAVQLSQIYVDADHHGQGVAAALMEWAVAAARAAGAPALVLTVWEHNARAQGFYRKHGFVRVGAVDFPVGEQIDTDLVMRLAL